MIREIILFISLFTYLLPQVGSAQFEGKIIYKIDYVAEKAELNGMTSMLPKKSELIVKGKKLRYDQALAGGGRQAFVIDAETQSNTLLMNFLGQEFKVNMQKEELLLLESAETLKILPTEKTREIAGYHCKMVYALSGEDSLRVYYTPEIQCPPVLPQFAEIKGLPLYYEMKKGDFFITYTCVEVKNQPIADSEFEIPGRIKEIPFNDFARTFAISK